MASVLKIIEQFNQSVKHLERAVTFSVGGDLGSAQIELGLSSNCIYSCLEWAFKNYIVNKYPDPVRNPTEYDLLNQPNFRKKLDLFKLNVTPNFQSKGINARIITDLKDDVRNNPEHSGYVPHHDSLVKVILETKKIIIAYIDPNSVLENIPTYNPVELNEDSNWNEFFLACDSFDKTKNYILLIGPTSGFSKDKLAFLGLLDWSLIIDFDTNSEVDGLLKHAKESIELRKKIHLVTNEDIVTFSPYNSCYWVLGNGITGRQSTIAADFKSWNRSYSTFIHKFLVSYFQAFGDKPTDLIIMWDDQPYVQKICESIDIVSGEKSKIVYGISELHKLKTLQELYGGATIEISIPQIIDGILRVRNFYATSPLGLICTLPSKDEEFVKVELADLIWFEEDFEVLHRNILDEFDFSNDDFFERERFYKGNQISWVGLHLRHDIDREQYPNIRKKVEKSLRDREAIKLILHHYPGIGGTTISRRLAWDLKEDYPVLLLKNYRTQDTIEKVFKIFELTKKSILLIAEVSTINIDDLNKLYNELLSRGFPCVFFLVQRSESTVGNNFTIPDLLTDIEFHTFITKYKELCPARSAFLDHILHSSNVKERHPFYLGLAAFEENFEGIESFISRNLEGATEIQRRIMAVISMCYFYGQKDISAQMLTTLLMTSENVIVILEKQLNKGLLSLLVNEEEIRWRPIHYLVSQQLLIQLLSWQSPTRAFWKNNLAELAISVIKLIGDKTSIPSDGETDLLKRLFVYRDNQEILGREEESRFSNFIENGLQTDEARLMIFLQLTISFPRESHFWAHLARYYSFTMKNHTEALKSISIAIDLSNENDSLLYHMKGMCLRTIAREKINDSKNKKKLPKDVTDEIYKLVDEAGENFFECRRINPSNEHGYISHIQLLINVIDFSFSISSFDNKTDFLRNLNPWLQEKLDLAEELLDSMKIQTQMKTNSHFVEQCDLALQELYENFSLVIEGWNNQLNKIDLNKSIIRRSIVRAYVRRGKSWELLSYSDIDKIIGLIEENIQEEPGNGTNIFLWFQAARQSDNIDINNAINKVSNWRALSENDESLYYLGILHTVQAIEGTSLSKIKAEKIIRELSEKKRNTPYRTHCSEWFGNRDGLKRLVPYKSAIKKRENFEFEFNKDILEKVRGKISFIKGPEAGNVELACGLVAHFIPARGAGFSRDRDVNQNVKFYLGFSNDGLRAYDVEFDRD